MEEEDGACLCAGAAQGMGALPALTQHHRYQKGQGRGGGVRLCCCGEGQGVSERRLSVITAQVCESLHTMEVSSEATPSGSGGVQVILNEPSPAPFSVTRMLTALAESTTLFLHCVLMDLEVRVPCHAHFPSCQNRKPWLLTGRQNRGETHCPLGPELRAAGFSTSQPSPEGEAQTVSSKHIPSAGCFTGIVG
ncbi:hypothetical protein JZ751_004598 [Albula glossodonta]|uniref:Uncharacterized protein n=1 Tax=Albula glossodonta TaxID=121402 RepID=A0A8T2N4X8_9TELE|nr:hypothetical protein JZ751_004598 [Albula glossodonta]